MVRLAWPPGNSLTSGLGDCSVGTPCGLASPLGFTERFVTPSIGVGITGNPGVEEMGLGA